MPDFPGKTGTRPSAASPRLLSPSERSSKPSFAEDWKVMNLYERFEQVVAVILANVIAVVIVISLYQLVRAVAVLVVTDSLDPLDHAVFQELFGMIMTLLIAMEFKHSILRVALRRGSIIQVKTVVLIALIALARKFVILDPAVDASKIAALSGAILALGMVYWLLRQGDDTQDTVSHSPLVQEIHDDERKKP
jgi:uncharacterized membrane protein (DUF373 family)